MIKPSAPIKLINQAEKNLEDIRESIKGLFEILSINFSEDDIYFKMSCDNLVKLYQIMIELILNDFGLKHIRNRLYITGKDLEIVLDRPYKLSIKPKIYRIKEKL